MLCVCSIEIEGGREVPVLDGSALGWAMEVQFAGLRLAPEASTLNQVGGAHCTACVRRPLHPPRMPRAH